MTSDLYPDCLRAFRAADAAPDLAAREAARAALLARIEASAQWRRCYAASTRWWTGASAPASGASGPAS